MARFKSILFVFCSFVTAGVAFAADSEMKLVATDFPPYSVIDNKGEAGGIAVEVMAAVAKRLSLTPKRVMLPASELDAASNSDVAIFATVTRTPKREKLYHWIGKLTDDHYCLAMLKTHTPASTLDEARALKAIGVNRNSGTEAKLDGLGLKNKDQAGNNSGNVRKLLAGRVDAWFAPSSIVADSIRREKFDPDKVHCLGNFGETSYWAAASLKTDEATLAKLKTTFSQLEKEGVVDSIFKQNGLSEQRAHR